MVRDAISANELVSIKGACHPPNKEGIIPHKFISYSSHIKALK
jgi:hypothetical protein